MSDQAEWRSIETAPKDEEAIFWVCPIGISDEYFVDTSGNPILGSGNPRIFVGKYRRWSSLEKGTHWMPLPPPPKDAL